MIREITPAKTWAWALTAYVIGLVGGTTAIGAIVGWIGTLLQNAGVIAIQNPLWLMFLALVALFCGLRELGIVPLPVIQTGWLVPAAWSKYGKLIQAFLYGVVLGLEVFTLVPYATSYTIILFQLSVGMTRGALIGLAYGVARASSSIGSSVYTHLGQYDIDSITGKILLSIPYLHISNGIMLLIIGEALAINVLLIN